MDTESVERVSLSQSVNDLILYRIKEAPYFDDLLETYIVDTPEAREIAAYQHIVGSQLESKCLNCARKMIKPILELTSISKANASRIVHLHVLRAAPGYHLHSALEESLGEIRHAFVRPRYVKVSYRDHLGAESMILRVDYKDFSSVPVREEIIVVKPDTEATGRTAEVSLKSFFEKCEEIDSRIKELILYGFISAKGLLKIKETASSLGVGKIIAFAFVDLTALAYNNYDMVLYGIDESLWKEKKQLSRLGSIVAKETLRSMVSMYVPGLDQPGDFSERQKRLWNGEKWTYGDILGHLRKTADIIKSIKAIPGALEPWQEKIANKQLEMLYMKIRELSSKGGSYDTI
ncbi:MAG: hypothetical protein DRO00_02810 [Thermoproteota archaeon]|nr:MAG: hypothetical protein DRO00_02810 [Candidatus Korarchaeota archaeon]